MARVDADRNLLLGILAVQMDFVTRDALFEAMKDWIFRKQTPLGTVLAERGDLAKSRRDLLEALVDEHVRAHGGDPARSLQALSSIGPVAGDLGKFSDPDLQASVGHLPTFATIDPLATRAPEPLGRHTSWNGRFRVVRPHASGGLGVVSVALDDELDREVAFKEIKDEYADEGGKRARFVLEAEITGKLEHPGIIPIYGLGHDPSGRPFYAMRFIRGDSLADAINRYHDPNGPYVDPVRRSLQLRELLGRFLDVCDALAYAHSRGVLHRDLKPGNVMLGPFGETLVVDWGLALPLDRIPEGHESTFAAVKSTKADSGSLPSEQGAVVGTPAYMPPEQAEGALDRLGPRSDVYGLGAILYDLLTGKRPVEGKSLEEILRRVHLGEIRPPRQIRPEISVSLEAVCLKALALKPEDRYATPRALAADIKAWLADEPVSARREPFTERARRWGKRHRTTVTAASAALLVGLVGLGAVATVETKAARELDRKNGELTESNTKVTKANTDLTLANAALDAQRRRAEDNESQAIDAVKKFRDAVANEAELKNTPALEGLRKRLLSEPLAFFRALRDRLQADRDTRTESLARLASAGFDLGVLTNEIGNKQDALLAFREALTVFEKLVDANPIVTTFQRDLAAVYSNLGLILKDNGKPDEALTAFGKSLTIRQKLADANLSVTQFQSDLAAAHSNLGVIRKSIGKEAEALKAYQEALKIRQKLADANPAEAQLQSDLVASHNNIGNLLGDTGKPVEALKAYDSAMRISRKLAEANPSVNSFQHDLGRSYYSIGALWRETGKPGEALKAHQMALTIRRKLAEANPSVTQFQSDLAGSYNVVGILQRATGKPAEALTSQTSAVSIWQKLGDANPTDTQVQSGLANTHNNIGLLLWSGGKIPESLSSYESAVAIWKKLVDANPTVSQFQRYLALSYNNMGNPLSALGKPAEVRKVFESSAEILQKLAKEHPESPDIAGELGASLSNIAATDLDAKRFAEARDRLRQARDWQRKALALNPANPGYRRYLADNLENLIEAYQGLGDPEGTAEAKRELVELRDSDPSIVALDARLTVVVKGDQAPKNNRERLQLAQRAYDKSLHTAAAKLWADALNADPKSAEDRQTQTRYNAACAAALAGSGHGKDVPAPDEAAKAKLREQARGWLNEELTLWGKVLAGGNEPDRKQLVEKTLAHWKDDSDLAGVRGEMALAALPEVEREPWRALWVSVDALPAKAQTSTAPVGEK